MPSQFNYHNDIPDSKVNGDNIGPIWDPNSDFSKNIC